MKRRAELGPPGYRRRFSSVAKLVTLSIVIGRDKKAIFDQFFDERTAGGTLPFYMPDPTTDGWPLLSSDGLPLLTGSGVPLLLASRWLCLFGDTLPTETILGVQFRMSFSVVVMP